MVISKPKILQKTPKKLLPIDKTQAISDNFRIVLSKSWYHIHK